MHVHVGRAPCDGVADRTIRMPCGSTSTCWPGNTTVVEPNSSITAGPSSRWPAGQGGAVMDRRVAEGAVEIDLAVGFRRGRAARPRRQLRQARPLDQPEAGDAEVHQFHLLLPRVIIPEGAAMHGMEGSDQRREERGVDRAGRRRHPHLHGLAGVAQVGFAHHADALRARCRRAPASPPLPAPSPA